MSASTSASPAPRTVRVAAVVMAFQGGVLLLTAVAGTVLGVAAVIGGRWDGGVAGALPYALGFGVVLPALGFVCGLASAELRAGSRRWWLASMVIFAGLQALDAADRVWHADRAVGPGLALGLPTIGLVLLLTPAAARHFRTGPHEPGPELPET